MITHAKLSPLLFHAVRSGQCTEAVAYVLNELDHVEDQTLALNQLAGHTADLTYARNTVKNIQTDRWIKNARPPTLTEQKGAFKPLLDTIVKESDAEQAARVSGDESPTERRINDWIKLAFMPQMLFLYLWIGMAVMLWGDFLAAFRGLLQ